MPRQVGHEAIQQGQPLHEEKHQSEPVERPKSKTEAVGEDPDCDGGRWRGCGDWDRHLKSGGGWGMEEQELANKDSELIRGSAFWYVYPAYDMSVDASFKRNGVD